MAGLIAAYLAELDARLAFDPELKARAGAEVRDHLGEALDHERGRHPDEAETRVLARFGRADEIARALIRAARPRRIRQAAYLAGGLALQLFVFMRLRNPGLTPDAIAPDPALGLAVWIDRLAFMGAILAGLVGLAMLRRNLRGALAICFLATSGLAVSIGAGGYIAAGLAVRSGSAEAVVLMAASPIELVLLALLVIRLRFLAGYCAA